MASLDIAFEPLLSKPQKQQQQQQPQQTQNNKKVCKKISTVCPNCKPSENDKSHVYITNDFKKTCGCAKCGHLFWKHGVTPQCNCGDCLKDCDII
jgi:uncharacterized protein with PIN domain